MTPRDRAQAREIVEACDHAFRDRVAAACELCIVTALAAREAETKEACAKIVEDLVGKLGAAHLAAAIREARA